MKTSLKWISKFFIVYAFVSCLPFFTEIQIFSGKQTSISVSSFANIAHAQTAGNSIPQGWESYLDRPDILKVPAQSMAQNETWQKIKDAHFSFIAQLLETYPKDTHLYFLARDSEHLYDVARLVTQGTQDFERIHLLNVSRANMRNKNVMPYLADNGISPEAIQKGKKVLFIDTGFAGTIPRVIAENFPKDLRSKLKTQLLVSSNPDHPSARSFLVHLNPSVNEKNPSSMHGTIVSYEHMARYTDRSSEYVFFNGKYHPISPIGKSSDGSVSKEKSLAFMMDFKAEWQKPEVQAEFKRQRQQVRKIKALLMKGDDESKEKIKNELKNRENTNEGRIFEAQVRDLIEANKNIDQMARATLPELGLNIILEGNSYSKKNELIKKYPEWGPVLENPDAEIPKLFQANDWQMIGNLIDANVDDEINKLLIKQLYNEVATGIKKDFQVLMIEKGNQEILTQIAVFGFSQPQTEKMTDLLKMVIEKGNTWTLSALVRSVFSKPHTKNMTDLLRVLIDKNNSDILTNLAMHTFSKPHTESMTDLLKMVIEKGDTNTLASLTHHTFSQPHAQNMTDLLKILIEKADLVTLQGLAAFTFSQPHTEKMTDLLKMVIEKADQKTLYSLAQLTFSKPHTQNMKDLLKMVIEKGDQDVLYHLAKHTFSQPHTQNMTDLLKMVIEKADHVAVRALAESTFSQPHTQNMTDLLSMMIEKATQNNLKFMILYVFNDANFEKMSKSLKLIIEKADSDTLRYIEHYLFSGDRPLSANREILKQALKIQDPVARKAWLDANYKQNSQNNSNQLVKNSLSPSQTDIELKPISTQLQPKDKIKVRDQILEVVKKGGEGRRGIVFQVRASSGALYALKVAKDSSPETLNSIAQESSKAQTWQRLKIPHAKVLVQEQTFVLKPWINGIKGDEAIQKYASGDASFKVAAEQALNLVAKIRDQGAYVGDFRPANLIWTGKAWVIIDSGSIQEGMTLQEAQAKWESQDARGPKFQRRWQIPVPPMILKCSKVYGKAS